jgi:hypothetical protein
MSKKNGGQAFPSVSISSEEIHSYREEGMSLIAWFAGQALQGLVKNYYGRGDSFETIAKDAWEMAQNMIAEKEKINEKEK